MTELPEDRGAEGADEPMEIAPGNSVLEFLRSKTGDAPRVTLNEEDSASIASPVIDPRSQEKLAIPQGRGTYQLMGEIARGGMGVILKGHDTDLGRDVAVKVLDKRLCERMDVVQRFVEEAQIGGQLQHPGIVPVYELGLMADERPYFTMKLVKGRTLATLLAERQNAADQRRHLIDVFESVCQTMAYAHSRGVIHRDLKPANIMVGAFGEVQVVDWGLAKVLLRGGTADEKRARARQSTQLTILETVRSSDSSGSGSESMVGSVMGTPAYMPPEQASGLVDRLDERSDVFSLGAILCEILTGLPPYVGERDKIISDAGQAELDPAYERLDACGADAELIKLTKHCLTPASAARPANAGVVAERVHEHVVSVDERAQKAQVEAAEARVRAVQERKARNLTLALGLAVIGMGAIGGGGWLWVQNERAAQEREEAERLRLAAERDNQLRAGVSEAMNTAAVFEGGEQWSDAIVAAERARALAEGGDASAELTEPIDTMLVRLRAGLDAARTSEELARDNAELLTELATIQPDEDMGDLVMDLRARAQRYQGVFLDHELDLDEGSVQDAAEAIRGRGLSSEVALVLDTWADLRRTTYDDVGAQRLLEIAQLVDPDPLRGHLREALAERQYDELYLLAESDLEEQPAGTIALLASSLTRILDREAAEELYRAGIERYPDDFGLVYGLARLLTPRELDNGVRADLEDAAECYRAALALDPRNESVRYHLGRVYSKMNESRRALDQFEAALQLHPDFSRYLFHVATQNVKLGNYDMAQEIFEELLLRPEPDWLIPWTHHQLADLHYRRGELELALEHIERAVEIYPGSTRFDGTLLQIVGDIGSQELILDVTRRSVERFPDDSGSHNNLAWFLTLNARGDRELLDEALRHIERSIELDGGGDATSLNTLGVVQYYLGQYEDAIVSLHQSDALEEHVSNWTFLAMANHAKGDLEVARLWYDRAIVWEKVNGSDDPETTRFLAEMKAVVAGE